jgi:hypothetical protein
MCWGVLVGRAVGCAACLATPLTRSPALETARIHLVGTRSGPRAPERPQARATPADRSTLQEVRDACDNCLVSS